MAQDARGRLEAAAADELQAQTILSSVPKPVRRGGVTRTAERFWFRCEGEYWTIRYGTQLLRLRDSKGLRMLSLLLTRPRQRVSSEALIELANTAPLALGKQIDTAAAAVPKANGAHAERCRIRVRRLLVAAISKIALHHPALAAHLRHSVRTGACCVYQPTAAEERRWITR